MDLISVVLAFLLIFSAFLFEIGICVVLLVLFVKGVSFIIESIDEALDRDKEE